MKSGGKDVLHYWKKKKKTNESLTTNKNGTEKPRKKTIYSYFTADFLSLWAGP
jgi:hypothetical protein